MKEEILCVLRNTLKSLEDLKDLPTEKQGKTYFSKYPSIIIFLSFCKVYFPNDIKISVQLKYYMNALVTEIKKMKVISTSFYYGILGIAYAVNICAKETGNYANLLSSIEKLHLKLVESQLMVIKEKNEIEERDYDILQGISGNLIYLLNTHVPNSDTRLIEEILKYLVGLTQNNFKKMNILPQSMVNLELREIYKHGYINLSLSHGMGGVLYVLSLAIEKNIIVDGQVQAIKNILELYCESFRRTKKLSDWNARYTNEANEVFYGKCRISWCYGILSILRVVELASKLVNDKTMKQIVDEKLEAIISLPLIDWNLTSVTFCHGWSGALGVLSTINCSRKSSDIEQLIDKIVENILIINDKKHLEYSIDSGNLSILESNLGTMMVLAKTLNKKVETDYFKMFCV